ncbi:uncharacterized protein PHACADRAFT_264129 [Phanerochaete carnosa HHB-10118-sp]|uniref:pyridoxal kinase n=1 Tax=Phanerochaete carnosa (strain HHB-10118-sp) TaxID=650164 RepID=K5WKA7_PHACS|nr:uncharacterized protein PHACADRAFT_264129 [Phanerochaete carnosa HHB-10118-sp]EKM50702.1 hypothetical protein PHACADRAFT_264129 [Phanerochaete carnosa HHB-10118-sp]
MLKGRILSIQSHVAFGYVGGKAAVFPLQCLGYDVDVVNTVNFSNHTGYGRFGGSRATAAELGNVLENMEKNHLLQPERLLTGYIPGSEALSVVLSLAQKLTENNPEIIYLLDPVLGDSGKLYVSPDVIPIYRAMLPLSTIITPNWFEVEVLTDVQMTDVPSLRRALKILHERYQVPNVVISSIPLKPWLLEGLPSQNRPPAGTDTNTEYLLCIASSATDTTKGPQPSAVHTRHVPWIPGYFSGVGDLFSALVLAHFRSSHGSTPGSHLAHAVSQALGKTHAILKLTDEYATTLPEEDRLPTDEELDQKEPERKTRRMKGRELRLVQGQDIVRTAALQDAKMNPWEGFWEE